MTFVDYFLSKVELSESKTELKKIKNNALMQIDGYVNKSSACKLVCLLTTAYDCRHTQLNFLTELELVEEEI